MAGQDPDAMQREIEQTRAELAATIDAIAERVSPRRMATRGAQRVRSTVGSVFAGEPSANGEGVPLSVLDQEPRSLREEVTEQVRAVAERGGGAYTGATTYLVEHRLRPERVLLAVGLAAALAAVVVLWRRRG